ncbi:hypothetical protein GCM10017083_21970 [Thalassobaculum fulvum]|uniref:DUF2066 domain-containing protein n=1 Tax=Thalassobaculum fulvum TaxID=1633335 RepID=A0A918XRB8_9PROT|nr:DUF2066 domain-containing protein [Thalassobaculum fulvum]GHD49557.1 hypothetical protein GCM10017083_21970 [Thalassobaculum fulvum]
MIESSRREFPGLLRALLVLATVLVPALSSAAATAADADLFTVRAVPVDATAETAPAARDRAVAEGRREGFRRLVDRLVPAAEAAGIPAPTDAELQRMVLGFEVANERSSAVRWIAELTLAFDPGTVRGVLRSAGVSYAETRSLPVLVIPLYETGGETVLWREPNPWRNAWYDLPPQDGLVPFVVPYGDVADIRDLSPDQAVAGDVDALMRIAERYGARDTVVVAARPRAGGAVELAIQRLGPSGTDTTMLETVDGTGDLDEAKRLAPAVLRTVALVEEAWKRDNLIRPGFETLVTATVPLDSLQRWLTVREALDGLSIVSRYEVVQLMRREALVDVWVNGDAEQFRVALAQRDLELVPGAGDYILKQRGQPMPQPTGAAPAGSDTSAPAYPRAPAYGTAETVIVGPAPEAPPAGTAPAASPAAPAPTIRAPAIQ